MCAMETSVVPKLAPRKSLESMLVVGMNHNTGETNAREVVQGSLFKEEDNTQRKSKVVKMAQQG